jgi:hypothetical protein
MAQIAHGCNSAEATQSGSSININSNIISFSGWWDLTAPEASESYRMQYHIERKKNGGKS